jgi:hypothetical protein
MAASRSHSFAHLADAINTAFARWDHALGDGWTHLCTVDDERIDPLNELGIRPREPLSYFDWGVMPDQYGRRWIEDDGGENVPPNPDLGDLPPLLQW